MPTKYQISSFDDPYLKLYTLCFITLMFIPTHAHLRVQHRVQRSFFFLSHCNLSQLQIKRTFLPFMEKVVLHTQMDKSIQTDRGF